MHKYIGIDYHKRFSYGTIMLESGRIIKHSRFENSFSDLSQFLGDHSGDDCHAVLEAGYNSLVMYDWLDNLTDSVTLAHPRKVKIIAEAKVKTDKIDSELLAHLLRCDMIPAAHPSSQSARESKRILRHRLFLTKVSTMLKNRIHSLLDGYPHIRDERSVENIFTQTGLQWLKTIVLPDCSGKVLANDVSLLERIAHTIKMLDQWFTRKFQSDQQITRLKTIPGVGKFFSLLIMAEIDNIDRFSKPAKLHSYAGLVPTIHSSGGREYHGRLTPECNKYLRYAMIEAVIPAIRKDYSLKRYYEQIKQRKGANSAKVATARRLLTIVYRVLKEKRTYRVMG